MAKGSIERMVLAYDGSGNQILTPESNVVSVQVSPVGIDMDNGTPITPRVARMLYCEGIDQLPHKLVRIDPPGTMRRKTVLRERADGSRFYSEMELPIDHWKVVFEFERPDSRSPIGSKEWSVSVFNSRDARDPYFSNLPEPDRNAIVAAVLTEASNGH